MVNARFTEKKKGSMVFSTAKSTTSRRLARVAIAGAIVAAPLAAVAVPASASPVTGPEITEIRHDPWDNNNRWDCDRPGRLDDWDHHPGRWDDCNRPGWDDPWKIPRNVLPRGMFGSS